MQSKEYLNQYPPEVHVISLYFSIDNIRKYSGPAEPLFWFFIAYLIIRIFGKFFATHMVNLFPWIIQKPIEIREDLPAYYDCLKEQDISWSLKEEQYYKFGF